MRIGHNLLALNANNFLEVSSNKRDSITEKLSSGYRINRAADDAAGLSISEKMRSQIRGLGQASRNAQDAISLIQTAEGALNESQSMMQRIKELSIQANNDTYNVEDRLNIQTEIDQMIKEVDNIANNTEFNSLNLLDGTFSGSNSTPNVISNVTSYSSLTENMTLEEFLSRPSDTLNIIYIDETNEFQTTQSRDTNALDTISGYDNLKNSLKTEMVPQAVTSILNTFSPAFDYLASSSIVIGLKLYEDNSTTLAYVSASGSIGGSASFLSYQLGVNMKSLDFVDNEKTQLTTNSRNNLEATIVHEMVHAIMDETLTKGMFGVGGSGSGFPGWFVEGMAQTASGGYSNGNDWVNAGLGITTNTSTSEILNKVTSANNSLTSGTSSSKYGTGYLASMYLGYLASGSSGVTATDISKGLGNLLSDVISGKSLDTAINERSGGLYTSTSDFENKFGDSNSTTFIYNLTQAVGNVGNGGLATGNLLDFDLLPDSPITTSLFSLDTTNDTVKNVYPSDVNVASGGGTSTSGSGPVPDYTSTISGGGTGTPPTTTNPPTTPPTTNPPTVPTNPPTTPPSGPSQPGRTGGVKIQIGANGDQSLHINIESVKSQDLGINNLLVTTEEGRKKSIELIDNAIEKVSKIRSELGASQNRLEYSINNLNNAEENLQSAESRIRDIDMAKGMMEYSKYQILIQAGQAMLSQANQAPKNILQLLS